jgi:hypothetical protein
MPEIKQEAREASEAEAAWHKFRTARFAECEAMRKAFDALADLDADGKRRVLRWLEDGALFPARTESNDPWEPPF